MADPSPILITGCSSGAGHALAARLGRTGRLVIATAAQVELIADLERAGCRVWRLDVTDEASMAEAVTAIGEEYGPVWGLVALARQRRLGPVGSAPLDRVRRQFEASVFGLARLCQLVLPGMRAAGGGRIVLLGPTVQGAASGYQLAARDAVRAIAESLGQEVRPYDVHVSLVEPGPVPLDQPVTAATRQLGLAGARRPGGVRMAGVRIAAGPDRVAAGLESALLSRHPRARYHVGVAASVTRGALNLLPDRISGHRVAAQHPALLLTP
jgi:NAD(P)-dependent dehydrogenase (short-subunit alcohol dehydrogenase family)